MDFSELPPWLKLYIEWRLFNANNFTKKYLLDIIQQTVSIDRIIAIIDLLSGFNSKIFKKFSAENPEFQINSHYDIDYLPQLNVTLNTEQLQTVLHPTQLQPLLILAGAGAGKTAALTIRIVYLLISGVSADSILAVTFTNKAALEMQRRCLELIKKLITFAENPEYKNELQNILKCAETIKIGTFHSICFSFLKDKILDKYNFEIIGYSQMPQIADIELQKNIIKQFEELSPNINAEDILALFSKLRNNLISPALLKNDTTKFPKDLNINIDKTKFIKIFEGYENYLKSNNLIDFDLMIYYVVELLQTTEKICEYYRDRYAFFLIDEYQDTNYAQYIFTLKLTETRKNIFAVGDDDQSIYSWRGADINNILNFQKDFSDALIIKFERNYRSSANIIFAANNIFFDKSKALKKILRASGKNAISKSGYGEKITVFTAADDNEESEFCANAIKTEADKIIAQNIDNFNKIFETEKYNILSATNNLLQNYAYLNNYTDIFWQYTLAWANYMQQINDMQVINKCAIEEIVNLFWQFRNCVVENNCENITEKSIILSFFNELSETIDILRDSISVYKKFAIFCRLNAQKKILIETLTKYNIPVVDIGSMNFNESPITEILNLFLIIDNFVKSKFAQNYDIVFKNINEEIIKLSEFIGFRISAIERHKLIKLASEKYLLADNLDYKSLKNINLQNYLNSIKNICLEVYNNFYSFNLTKIFYLIIDFLNLKINDAANNKISVLKEIIFDIDYKNFDNNFGKINMISEFLENFYFRSNDTQFKSNYTDAAQLLTLHSAKGLEFDYVFFTGLEENICPFRYNTAIDFSNEQLSEERRLFYVGITRAKHKLIITHCQKRKIYNKLLFQKPSRFLKLIPTDLIEKI